MPDNNAEAKLDIVDHVALNVSDLDAAVSWYVSSFACKVIARTKTQATLMFANLKIALVLPSQQQPHLAFIRPDAGVFGELSAESDGLQSTAVSDPAGNIIELVAP